MKHLTLISLLVMTASIHAASGHQGQVKFGQVPVPGALIQFTQGEKTVRAVTDPERR